MKDFLKYSAFIFLIVLSAGSLAASNKIIVVKQRPVRAKVVIVKPVTPRAAIIRPTHIRTGYIWVDGYWKWHGRHKKYVWINGRVVKHKKNKHWVSGHWSKKYGGYYYVRGHWA